MCKCANAIHLHAMPVVQKPELGTGSANGKCKLQNNLFSMQLN
jgi:hypothetical protein